MRRVILHFEGHKNLSHKVPCFVDNNEQFVFASTYFFQNNKIYYGNF